MQLLPVVKTEKTFFYLFFFFHSLYRQVKSTLLTNAKKKIGSTIQEESCKLRRR